MLVFTVKMAMNVPNALVMPQTVSIDLYCIDTKALIIVSVFFST